MNDIGHNIQLSILRFVTRSNWVLLLITSVLGGAIAQFNVTLGIVAGGLIVTVNFHFMYRTLKKTLLPPPIFLRPNHFLQNII